jgi:predicted HNH restriction endonuclease
MALDDLARWNRKQAAYQRRKELRDRAIAYLGGKCRICGYDKCPAAFDFHHIDPMGKDFNISSGLTSWDRIVPELDKCVLLCSNCHREVHDGLHTGYLDDGYDRGGGSMYDLSWSDELEEFNS